MINNRVPVETPSGIAHFTEISFYEYKNICKMLVSDNVEDINNCIEYIIRENIKSSKNLDIIDIFKILLTFRNTTLGNEITFLHNDKRVNVDLSKILDKEFDNTPIHYENLLLSSPQSFYSKNYDEYIAQCLIAINGNSVSDLSLEQRIALLGETSHSITAVYKKIFDTFYKRNIEIMKDLSINIYSQEYILKFIKNILYEDLFQLMNFEYICIRNLDFKSNDFKNYTYPELKIFLNYLTKEQKEQKDTMSER